MQSAYVGQHNKLAGGDALRTCARVAVARTEEPRGTRCSRSDAHAGDPRVSRTLM